MSMTDMFYIKILYVLFKVKAASDAQHAELLKKVEMMNLLSESNNLLRMEKDSLLAAKSQLETQVLVKDFVLFVYY